MLERTVELATRTKAFDPRKLPKTLRVAIDSSPLEGAGRVEDTFNLLAHAARNVVRCAAGLLGWNEATVCRHAGIPLLLESSIKRALDIDWNDAVEKTEAITTFARQLDALQSWVARHLPEALATPPLKEQVETLVQIRTTAFALDVAARPIGAHQFLAQPRILLEQLVAGQPVARGALAGHGTVMPVLSKLYKYGILDSQPGTLSGPLNKDEGSSR